MKSISGAIKLLLFVIMGILINNYINKYSISSSTLIVTQICFLILLGFCYKKSFLASLISYTLFFIIAFNCSNMNYWNKINKQRVIESYKGNKINIEARINTVKTTSQGSFLESVLLNIGDYDISSFRVQSLIKTKGDCKYLNDGNIISFNGKISRIKPPRNPASFNAKLFYSRKGIYHESYLNSKDIKVLNNQSEKSNILQQIRSYFDKSIKSCFEDLQHASIVSALCLGDKSEMSKATKNSFISTGSIHVLAVSGLHVGIIYTLALALIKCIPFSNRLTTIQPIFLIGILILYALLTNHPNSVVRASMMLSIFLIGKAFSKFTSPYHIVCLSAITILLINPDALFQISFQFSYLALLGIMFFYKRLSTNKITNNNILNYSIQIILVSVSAQILITPLSIYHFNQFPAYFWLSSLIAIPLAFVTILLSIIFLVLNLFSIPILIKLSSIIANILESVVYFFAKAITIIERIPYGLITELYLHPISTFILYLIICSIILYIINQRKIFITTTLLLIILQYSFQIFIRNKCWNTELIEIYHKHKCSILTMSYQGKTIVNKSSNASFEIDHLISIRKIQQFVFYPESRFKKSAFGLYEFNSKHFFIHPKNIPNTNPTNLKIEFALINNMDTVKLDRLNKLYKPKAIITDGLTHWKSRNEISMWAKRREVRYHDTYVDGYYKILLN